ncbi:MAG TPA: KpsF/GutQ family sugar-phosphate isomerase [Nitrospiraceae bacterium]|nr:KpsF/GutQ family sugar-phosphate isomerase [Nitrospiraceae bacterium]
MRRSKTTKLKSTSPPAPKTVKSLGSLGDGKRVLEIEARAVQALIDRLDSRFAKAVDLLAQCKGKVVVSGMGKSGLIGQKIAATLASTGTSSFFLHPAEGVHGDLGMLARRDALIAISNSGETQELLQLLPYVERMGIPIVSMTGRVNSTLGKNSDVTLDVSVAEEACPMGLAPTASTTATLALGDALAVALLQKRGFKEEDFAQFHPGGTLGRRLLVRVKDLMHSGADLPQVTESVAGTAAMLEMTAKKLGMTTMVDQTGKLTGIITDGDLRRFIQRGGDFTKATAGELGSRNPKTIGPDDLAAKAVEMMERFSITTLVVTEGDRNIRGVIHLHDLLKSGIV